jgi:hypothetical protein
MIVELLSLLGGGHASCVTYEELHAKLAFEALDLLTEGRLRNAQYLRCARKVSGFCDLNEVFELAQIHPNLGFPRPMAIRLLSKYAFVKTIAYLLKYISIYSSLCCTSLHETRAGQMR